MLVLSYRYSYQLLIASICLLVSIFPSVSRSHVYSLLLLLCLHPPPFRPLWQHTNAHKAGLLSTLLHAGVVAVVSALMLGALFFYARLLH